MKATPTYRLGKRIEERFGCHKMRKGYEIQELASEAEMSEALAMVTVEDMANVGAVERAIGGSDARYHLYKLQPDWEEQIEAKVWNPERDITE